MVLTGVGKVVLVAAATTDVDVVFIENTPVGNKLGVQVIKVGAIVTFAELCGTPDGRGIGNGGGRPPVGCGT